MLSCKRLQRDALLLVLFFFFLPWQINLCIAAVVISTVSLPAQQHSCESSLRKGQNQALGKALRTCLSARCLPVYLRTRGPLFLRSYETELIILA